MRKALYLIFSCFFLITIITSCKPDKPIYPSGGVTGGTTGGLVNNGSTITYTISGTTTTLNMCAFQVIAPDASTLPNGNTQLLGGTSPAGGFTLSFSNTKPGTYDIDILYAAGYLGTNGKVIVTDLSTTDGFHGTIKGTFTTDLLDLTTNATITGASGTFSITI